MSMFGWSFAGFWNLGEVDGQRLAACHYGSAEAVPANVIVGCVFSCGSVKHVVVGPDSINLPSERRTPRLVAQPTRLLHVVRDLNDRVLLSQFIRSNLDRQRTGPGPTQPAWLNP